MRSLRWASVLSGDGDVSRLQLVVSWRWRAGRDAPVCGTGGISLGIGSMIRRPRCFCSQACARMPTERDRMKKTRPSSGSKPSS